MKKFFHRNKGIFLKYNIYYIIYIIMYYTYKHLNSQIYVLYQFHVKEWSLLLLNSLWLFLINQMTKKGFMYIF